MGLMLSDSLSTAAGRLRTKVQAAKAELTNIDFEWYPYGTLSNVGHIDQFVGAEMQAVLLEQARKNGVLDVGCQDGELGFLFESLGCSVVAIDNPVTNHNGMRGVRALREKLQSAIELHERDVDTQFSLPHERYGLAVLLGVLYHLKNPFFVMETLARHSNYCLLSTRIARRLTDGSAISPEMPIAYLLDAYELNNDDTNYWIFSEAALRRLIKRSGWEVCGYFTAGDKLHSDPVSIKADERAFYLLKSHFGLAHLKLIAGWHEAERTGWRWTKREFSIGLPDGGTETYQRMSMRVFIPQVLIERLGPLTLRAEFDGQELAPVPFNQPGEHAFSRRLGMIAGREQNVHFSLDKALYPGDFDHRELGIIVAAIEFD